ncbi:hypothetical protein ACIQ7D_08865 [Streptomyces sp. NPDC096310]|uniref:hypothetical protein n=1 Tax=Streptomyces sp. NPDC096310 TaxID=3366082 RepID=UPI00380715E7
MTNSPYSDEWQRLFDMAGRSGDSSADARMSLASASAGNTGGEPDLRHSDGPWTRAAGVAEELRTSITAAKSRLTSAHEGSATGTEGLTAMGTLKSVLISWEERLKSVQDECGSLAPKLRLVAQGQGEREVTVKSSFAGLDKPADAKAK